MRRINKRAEEQKYVWKSAAFGTVAHLVIEEERVPGGKTKIKTFCGSDFIRGAMGDEFSPVVGVESDINKLDIPKCVGCLLKKRGM